MIEKEFVTVLNLSFTLNFLEVVGAKFTITDMFVDLRLLFVEVIPARF